MTQKKAEALVRLVEVLDELREKCPWDKKQTMDSLRSNTIEECFELNDALIRKDYPNVCEELGDVLLHVLFYAKIAEEQKLFAFDDVANGICEKLIYRHPHVFADTSVQDAQEVSKNWEQLKQQEKGKENKRVLDGVPSALPALIKAFRIGQKSASVGFDWAHKQQVWEKVKEEIEEFEQEVEHQDVQAMEEEFGDVLFSLVNAARLYGIDPENALEKSNRKFIARFNTMQELIEQASQKMTDLSPRQFEAWWQCAKKETK